MIKESLAEACNLILQTKGLDGDPRYKKRLKWELEEVISRNKSDYFWNLYTNRTRYPQNQNNLLICWLLGIVPDHDIDKDPNCVYGEFPDIDVDYIPIVRDYLKNTWAKNTFGEDYVCNIGNYTRFGIKNALIDMARVHGGNRDEVQALTKNLEPKDDEGKPLTWDAALRLYPDLKAYCELDENHKRIADAAKKLLHRNRGTGVHAAGLIIANAPLFDLVPLVKKKDTPQASAWVEGLNGQDLGPVGLVKFDLLVIANLLQIARCCDMVKRRHNLDGICNKPGESDWTDIASWRDNPVSLAMANKGDTKGIFQFDSEGIRSMVRAGGVDRFEDLVAYSSLFRPGPLNCLRKGTKVSVFTGSVSIEKLEPGLDDIAYVSGDKSIKYTNKFFVTKTGKKKILRIKTKSGKVLYSSFDHLILTEGDQYVRADDLKINQKIGIIS